MLQKNFFFFEKDIFLPFTEKKRPFIFLKFLVVTYSFSWGLKYKQSGNPTIKAYRRRNSF